VYSFFKNIQLLPYLFHKTSVNIYVKFSSFCNVTPCILVEIYVHFQRKFNAIQIYQPTRCNSFSSQLLDVYVQLNMFRASSRSSSGAQQNIMNTSKWSHFNAVILPQKLLKKCKLKLADTESRLTNLIAPYVGPVQLLILRAVKLVL
jgi:hypothetical protein